MKLKSQSIISRLEQNLKSKIFGQDHAINKITDVLKVNSLGLGDDNKPIGSFLFTGPTGVGKTELAIQLAKELNMHFKRFDMSEYSEKYSIKNFIGGDAGLVGYDEGGLLVNYMQEYPRSVILFDEIEKAHKDVMNIFLQVLDYGHLTSTKGEEVFLHDCIIIFTSNLGVSTKQLRKTMGYISSFVLEDDFDDENELNTYLKPEFRGRMDCIIPFNHLDKRMISLIIDKNINELVNKLNKYSLTIEISDELKKSIIDNLSVDNLGARSIAKIFRENIKTLIADEIINRKITFKSNIKICINDNTNEIYLEIESNHSLNKTNEIVNLNEEESPWFADAIEAQEFAKQNPKTIITRSPCGNGYIAKHI